MKTRNAVIEHQHKQEDIEETVEAFEGEIKISYIMIRECQP